MKAARKPKFAVRGYTRCQRCGRPKAVYSKFVGGSCGGGGVVLRVLVIMHSQWSPSATWTLPSVSAGAPGAPYRCTTASRRSPQVGAVPADSATVCEPVAT